MPVTKKLYGPYQVAHPAPYSNALLPIFERVLLEYVPGAMGNEFYNAGVDFHILDPFAGVGRIHELPFSTIGVEIEPEWAAVRPSTIVADALSLPFKSRSFAAVCTSPCYGNRMADHHDAKDASVRRSYKHDIGRDLHPNNAGQLHWGPAYREFHERAWAEAVRVLQDGGLFVFNIKNHIRGGKEQKVTEWHIDALKGRGLTLIEQIKVATPGMRAGENRHLRCPEWVIVFRKQGVLETDVRTR